MWLKTAICSFVVCYVDIGQNSPVAPPLSAAPAVNTCNRSSNSNCPNHTTDCACGTSHRHVIAEHTFKYAHLPYLQKFPLPTLSVQKEFHISLLVSVDHYWDIVGDVIVCGDGLTAVESKVGYLLSPITTGQFLTTSESVMILTVLYTIWVQLGVFLEFRICRGNSSDNSVLDHCSTSCVTHGAYVARLPWKPNHPDLPTNCTIAKLTYGVFVSISWINWNHQS